MMFEAIITMGLGVVFVLLIVILILLAVMLIDAIMSM